MGKKYGYVIDPRGNRIETETVYDPLDDERFKSKRRRLRSGKRFAMLTEEQLKLLAKTHAAAAVVIYCYLLMVNWKKLRQPVKLTNAVLAKIGVSPDAKLRALPQLERVGLIKVKRVDRQAPVVTPLK